METATEKTTLHLISLVEPKDYDHLGEMPENVVHLFHNIPRLSREEIRSIQRKKTKLRSAQALYVLGVYYSHGLHGCRRDRFRGYQLLCRAAAMGHIASKGSVGARLYFVYRKKPQSKARWQTLNLAVRYLNEAANAGNLMANYGLYICYRQPGVDGLPDHREAIARLKYAFDNGFVPAAYVYGRLLIKAAARRGYPPAEREWAAIEERFQQEAQAA